MDKDSSRQPCHGRKRISYRLDVAALLGPAVQCNLACAGCHKDFFPIHREFDLKCSTTFVEGIRQVECAMRAPQEIARVIHISGRAEPLLIGERLCDVVSRLRNAYPAFTVALVTNGIGISHLAAPLFSAGLQRCTVSAHSGLSAQLSDAACALSRAGITVTLNIIIGPEIRSNFDAYLEFAAQQNVSMKFFPRLRGTDPGAADIANMLAAIRDSGLPEPILDRRLNRARFLLTGGRYIDVKLDMRERIRPEACVKCDRASSCLEGCWESIRITPWYVKPCGVREDNVYFFSEHSKLALLAKLKSGGKTITETW